MHYEKETYLNAVKADREGVAKTSRREMERLANGILLLQAPIPPLLGSIPHHLAAFETPMDLAFFKRVYEDLFPLFARHNKGHINTLITAYTLTKEGPQR